jgi:hypothetical protein
MQEAPPWKAVLCMAWSSTALGVPRSARERLDCQDPGVNLPPILGLLCLELSYSATTRQIN